MSDTLSQQKMEELRHGERRKVIAARNEQRTNKIAELNRIIRAATIELQRLQNEGL